MILLFCVLIVFFYILMVVYTIDLGHRWTLELSDGKAGIC